jgi:putative ABC transport system permease protein
MKTLLQDLRYSFRMLAKNPGFTVVAVLTLALGIGANTSIFSVVDGVMLRALPYKDSDRLAMLWTQTQKSPGLEQRTSIPNFEDWRVQSSAFEGMAFHSGTGHATLSDSRPDAADPEVTWYTNVSGSFFEVLGVAPVLGRTIAESDVAHGERVAVLSYQLWQRRYAASPNILGQILHLESRDFQVIGVLPRDFRFPDKKSALWVPTSVDPQWSIYRADRSYGTAVVFGRLSQDATIQQAQDEMNTIAGRLQQQYPEANADSLVNIVPLQVQVFGKTVPFMLLVLLGAVLFVLLIACTNVASLLLARGAAREREIAVRTALGASRTRLIRQLLTESTVLALAAGSLGLLFAAWGVDALVLLAPQDIPRLDEVGIDRRVLGFTVAISVLAGLVFGLLPAMKISRSHPAESLTGTTRTSSASARAQTMRRILVVAECALAVILLTGAGLFIRSFLAVLAVDPGFRPDRVLTLRLSIRDPGFAEQVMERIRALPGVTAVGTFHGRMFFEGAENIANDPSARVWTATSGEAFQALGIPLLKGRFFSDRDGQSDSPPVALVNETMANRSWPGEDPIGKTIPFRDQQVTVIGLLKDIRNTGLEREPVPQIFPAPQPGRLGAFLVVRTTSDPLPLVAEVRAIIRSLDKRAALWSVSTLEQQLEEQTSQRRFQTYLLGLFSAIALLLAGVGVYGVLHYSVAQRTQEIGIRMALGARAGEVLRMVLREGMTLALIGVTLGLVGAWMLMRTLSSLLFGVSPTDPATFTVVALMLMAAAFVACSVPARRATKVDPMIALRCE